MTIRIREEGQAFDDEGDHVQSVDFDYTAIDQAELEKEIEGMSPDDIARAGAAIRALMGWVWQIAPKNRNGLEIRAVIACWIFLEYLRPTKLTTLAEMTHHVCPKCHHEIDHCPKCHKPFDRAKQSLGRWVDDFKKRFPFIKTNNMKFK
jgi:hypothetical protein